MDILLLPSARFTGTRFLCDLLQSHPAIGDCLRFPLKFEKSFLLSPSRNLWLTNLKFRMVDYYRKEKGIPERYAFFRAHIAPFVAGESFLMAPLIGLRPFNFKVVAPVRHPLSILRTLQRFKRRGGIEGMGHALDPILHLLMTLKANGDFFLVPVDLWGLLSTDERVAKMKEVMTYLGLELDEGPLEKIEEWSPISHFTDEECAKDSELDQQLSLLVHQSKVLKLLQRGFGVVYDRMPPAIRPRVVLGW